MSWDLIEECKKLIAIHSDGTHGTREAVQFLSPFCKQLGLNLTLQPASEKSSETEVNLLAHTLPSGSPDLCPKGLLFVTHLDTVPAGEKSLWTETDGDPFRPIIKGDRLYGLGSADTKLDILCKLKALEQVGVKNLKGPFCLAGTYGEERALAGIKKLSASGLMKPRFALVGEPSELKPVLKHKGILYMKAVFASPLPPAGEGSGVRAFHGRAAHGSTPHLGENAILKAFTWLFEQQQKNPNLQLVSIEGGTVHNIVPEKCSVVTASGKGPCPRINFLKSFSALLETADQKICQAKDPAFNPPITTCNVGVIRTGPEGVEIEFDYRLIPSTSVNDLFPIFQRIQEIPGGKIEKISANSPMDTDRESDLVKLCSAALKEVGLPVEFHAKAGNTEGAILSQMGAQAIVLGPGRSTDNIHKPNEANEISQLKKAVEFYTAFLKKFC